ncbi:MAG: histidinol-phosphatase HisJ family protein [Lachnospiraceae bacterium]|nr:histidinol-phosphatase HisJ family protein [Lachnospiraceae bacterium]
MLWDTHMHTHFSVDSDAGSLEMVHAAIEADVDGICITDHLDLLVPDTETDDFPLDLPSYFSEISSLQTQFHRKFPINIGVEIGLQPFLKNQLPEIISRYPFDFVIGSSHMVNGEDPYYPEFFIGKDEDKAYQEYFESILENLTLFDCFDVYGHLDYIVRYGPSKNQHYTYDKFADVLEEILKTLIQKGKGIEINTGGFKYGLGHPNPTEDILKRYRELGGEIITIGADAHKPEHVAYDFKKVPEILAGCGFEYYTVFQNRKPLFYKIGRIHS